MISKNIRNAGVSLIVLLCMAVSTMPAYASWETGINVITTVEEGLDKSQDFDTPEEFTAEVIRLVNVEREDEGLTAFSCLEALMKPATIRARNPQHYLLTKDRMEEAAQQYIQIAALLTERLEKI